MDKQALAARLANLSPAQREKLLGKIQHYKGKSGKASDLQLIQAVDGSSISLLSFSQQRLWFLDQFEGQNPSYNMPALLRVEGELNLDALLRAFNTIVTRHEILRTTFRGLEGVGQQVVEDVLEVALGFDDVSLLEAEKKQSKIKQATDAFFKSCFDLSILPLFNVQVIKTAECQYHILLNFHHIIFDGWSVGIFTRELEYFYNSYSKGQNDELSPLPIQYADFSRWQREYLNDARIEQELNFWRNYLESAPELQMPLDYPRAEELSFEGGRFPVVLPLSLSNELKKLSQEQGVTIYTSLLAIFMLLCSRYSGQNDVVVGSPIANRTQSEIEALIGFFVNSLALREVINPEQNFLQLQRTLQNNLREVWQHQSLPFEKLVDELNVPRVKNKTPVFQHLFVWQGDDVININLDGLKVFPEPPRLEVSKFDLTLTLSKNAGRIEGEIEYCSAYYKPETIARFAKHFEKLVELVCANPENKLSDFSLLTEQEIGQLDSFNSCPDIIDWPEKSLVERFEKQVASFPENIAICLGRQQFSYLQLNERANQLGFYLREEGVTEGTRVALYFERSIDLIAAILAVLKCGASYIPVDPGSATSRNEMILEDAQVHLLLGDKDFFYTDIKSINIAKLEEALKSYSKENLGLEVDKNAQAYMIYTSGTTGKPKGVPIHHFNVMRLFSQSSPPFEFSENDCWTLFHSYAFDFSVWEIWGALLFGGRLVVVPTEVTRDPELFYDLLESEKITVLNQTPAAFNQLVTIDQDRLTTNLVLRYVVFGGEALNFPQLKPWVSRYGYDSPKLVNMYGITETTVHVTWHIISENDFLYPLSNIGRPLADLAIYLLDESGLQVPLGAIGEIYVAGRGLSDGYWQRDELNVERFVTKTIGDHEQRLYKSGDLARYNSEGELIYVGRNDEQVKIRGYRIELGEVNAQLKSCAVVRVSVVISDEEKKQLLAFVVLDETSGKNQTISIEAIRKELADKLPQYMMPAFIYARQDLPLTHNGKIDKKHLLEQHKNTPVHSADNPLASAHAAPRNPVEEQLGEIWKDVLGLEWVGVFDNFFELGGDSILSLQIISRAKKAGLSISAKQLFEYQTIAELAEVATDAAEKIIAKQESLTGELPLNPIQNWFFDNVAGGKIPNPNYWNQSLVFKLKATLTQGQLAAAWEKILSKHDQLRCSFRKGESNWVGYFNERLDINTLVQEHRCEEHSLQSVTSHYEAALDIEKGPLQKVVLIHCPEQDYLFITAHHLLVDGVSWRIILDDLQTLLLNPDSDLGLKSTSFFEANAFLQSQIENNELEEQSSYWSQQVESCEPLFSEKSRPQCTHLRESQQRKLDSATTRKLIQESVKNFQNDVNELLVAALLLSLKKTNKMDAFRIDLESHGRTLDSEKMDLSQTVGWFTALYPQRFVLPKEYSLAELLISVKEQLRTVPQQGLAYGWLSQQGQCAALRECSADILFNYLGQVHQQGSDVFEWTSVISPQQIADDNAAIYPLEINASIQDDALSISCQYDAQRFSTNTVAHFLDVYCEALQQLSLYCADASHFAYSQSDFPLLSLPEEALSGVCKTLTLRDKSRQLESVYPLSAMQEGMLFHALHDESGETYFEQMTIEINGTLDKQALQRAWELTQFRHPILRSGFIWDELPQALQFVRGDAPESIQFHPEGDAQALQKLLADERQAGFDLGRAGLIRIGVMPKASSAYYLVFNFHHLILDGWSVSLVLTDLFRFYRGILAGQEIKPQAGPPYEQFIRYLVNEDKQAADDFWREQLLDFERATPLPCVESQWPLEGEKSSRQQSYETEEKCFSETFTRDLEKFTKRHHLTLNTLFQGAWAYLLSRYAGDEKVLFGTTVSGRPAHLPQVEQMAGMFINTLPFSVDVPSGPVDQNTQSILSWLESLQYQHVAMRPFESTSLSALQRLCGLGGGEHLFESILVFENYPVDQALSAAEMPFEVGEVQAVWKTNFPLTLIFVPGKQLTMKISYQGELFSLASIQRLMSQFQHTLENFLEYADKPVQEISLLDKAERVRMLHIWNQTARPYPSESNIGAEFDVAVSSAPHHPALWSEGEVLSYQALAQRANQLAHYLVEQGVGAETVVAYCGERSVNLLVSLLAIVKAGGAYLPLDPHYPDERLFYMLEDSGAKIVLCSAKQGARFEGCDLLVIDDGIGLESQPCHAPDISVRADQLAHVIYTSGSTGRAKGIEITHRNVLRLVKNSNVLTFTPDDICLHYASIAFDAATWEIWGALLNGAKLVLAPPGHLDPEQFGQLVRSQSISHAFLTTALFHTMVEFNPEAMGFLKVAMTGGEVVNAARVRDLLSAHPHLRFINFYGPSENTTITTTYTTQNAEDISRSVSIGRPVSNTQVYILDQNLRPLPVGMVGELCTAGDGVARGYRFKPELTRKAFVPNPFAKVYGHGPVLYRTGDVARFRVDGSIEFLGRQDHQVKIRGHRIELGEVEAAIKQAGGKVHDCALRDVVVRAQKSERGSQLVAWVVLDEPAQLEMLKTTVAEFLPAYMVPTFWTCIEKLPLTPNGKVDHRALPQPERSHAPQRLPQSETEKTLAQIWENLLGIPQVGLHDNFFALGGDSILSIQVVSRAKRAGIRFSTKQLFENQTIAELANVAGSAESLIAQQDAVTQNAALTPIQHWFYEHSFAHAEHWNMSLLLQPAADLHSEADIQQAITTTEQAMRALVKQHDMLRAYYPKEKSPKEQYPAEKHPQGEQQYLPLDWQHPLMQSMFSVEALSLEEGALDEALRNAQASLDLETGPLFRAIWYKIGGQHRLLIVAHHLIIDGVSWRILLEDLALAMGQQAEGKAIDLGRKTTAFPHWAERLWQFAHEESVLAQKAYWQGIEREDVACIQADLADTTALQNLAKHTQSQTFLLDAERTEQLLRQVPKAFNTEISDLLLAALVETLNNINHEQGQQSGKQLIALEGHGREFLGEQWDTSRTLGWFTTLYPVLLQSEGENWGQKIKALKQQLREVPGNGLAYGLLRYQQQHMLETGDISDAESAFQAGTVPQVSFNYLGQTGNLFNDSQAFKVAQESPGQERSAESHQPYLLDVAGIIQNGEAGAQLQIMWRYSDQLFSAEKVERWVGQYQANLSALIDYCLAPQHGGRVPADFPLLSLSQQDVDFLLPQPREVEAIYPLAPLQEGLWFHHKLSEGHVSYHEQQVVSLEGKLDVSLLQEAWQQICNRHSIFRTGFVEVGDDPVQRVSKHVDLPITQYSTRDMGLDTLLSTDRLQNFDFEQAPLMRVAVLSSENNQHDMVWSFHHILLDGWSVTLVLGELLQCYQQLAAEDLSQPLPPAPPYQDYIQWLSQQDEDHAKEYWRGALTGFRAPTPLPGQRALKNASNIADEEQNSDKLKPIIRQELSAALVENLRVYAQNQQVTLNTIFQGAWAYLLSVYSGNKDVVFGITVSGRPAELTDIEQRVGLFINSLPMRVQLDKNQNTGQWLQNLQAQQTEARAYEYLPLFTIQSLSEVREDIFQSLLVFENYPVDEELAKTPTALKVLGSQSIEETHYPLTLVILPGEKIHVQITYDESQFPKQQIERILSQLTQVLTQLVSENIEPKTAQNNIQSVESISLLTPNDLAQIGQLNKTSVPLSSNDTVLNLIHSYASLSPSSIALSDGNKQQSFKQLDQQSNQIAHYLLKQGLKKEGVVAIVAERGIHTITAMLATLKAGGVFLPIDPYNPVERIQYILEDAQAHCIFIASNDMKRLSPHINNQIIGLEDSSLWSDHSKENPSTYIDQNQLAYMIYTSGSTGQPKGVQIEHRSLLNFCQWARKYLDIHAHHRQSVMAGSSFDASLIELFPPLTAGASLHFMPETIKLDPPKHMAWLYEYEITHVFMPTVLVEQFIQQTPPSDTKLKSVMTGGEKLNQWPTAELPYELINAYGPSEATIIASAYKISAEENGVPAIGEAIDNTRIYILDRNKNLLPPGMSGELHIAGTGLARSYHNKAELTKEKFFDLCIEDSGTERLYATGDMARYNEAGQLEYMGRYDHQIKIRGVRIELGEIESQLCKQKGIKQAVVLPFDSVANVKNLQREGLVAYVETSVDIDKRQLRKQLLEHLPEVMVPTVFQTVEKFHLTPNGKIDRKHLPALDIPETEDNYLPPQTEIEIKLAEIWQHVLGVEKIGIQDDFFELGGHSLLATKVHNRMRDAFMLEIPLRTLFEITTIAELAGLIQTLLAGSNKTEIENDDDFEEGAF